MQKGRANSALGWLGVVDVPAFRKWLQRAFVPLPKVAPAPGVVTLPMAPPTADLPVAPDSTPAVVGG